MREVEGNLYPHTISNRVPSYEIYFECPWCDNLQTFAGTFTAVKISLTKIFTKAICEHCDGESLVGLPTVDYNWHLGHPLEEE